MMVFYYKSSDLKSLLGLGGGGTSSFHICDREQGISHTAYGFDQQDGLVTCAHEYSVVHFSLAINNTG